MTSPSKKILKSIPAKDIRWVHYIDNNHCEWLATSRPDRSVYFLYKQLPDGYELVVKSATPAGFSDIVFPPEKEAKS